MKSSTLSSQARVAKPLIKSMKKVPSQLIKDQESGKSILEQFPKPKIIQFLNIGDNSIHTDSQVHVDEPLFAPEPHVIQFTNYEPLQTKEQILKLRNKDKVARSIKIIPPDSKLFSVTPAKKTMVTSKKTTGSFSATQSQQASDIDQMSCKVAPGMEISYIVKFSPEAKSDYAYDLVVLTEREKFVLPIRAIGCRAMVDFPDQLDFGLVPVKYETEKPVMIRNIGEKTTKWQIKVPPSFKVNQSEGILEIGQTTQLIFVFVPQEARHYKEELTLTYDQMEATIPIIGETHNDNVYLSKSHIHTDPTSITLFSHQYFQIVNKSAVPVEFSWRAFATGREESDKKQRLCMQLTQEEEEERAEVEHAINEGESDDDGSLDSDDSYNETELAAKKARRQEKAVATLGRKYESIKKAVEEDKMLFQDEIFQIEPLEGKIWPNTEMTCCVTFRPQGPYHYSCTAFANVTCSQERLTMNLTGQGKGPQAQLSITEMDIGDIFVTNQKSFELGIENTGEIDCHWKLIPYETPFGSKFSFSKTEGILGVKEHPRDLLKVTFKSDILGEFSETFRFALEGSSEMLTLTFKGHVVAPTFKFSEDIIDFGKVSYKFQVQKTVYLTNTSEVDINYVVRVPGDGRSLQTEFNIKNNVGRLDKDKQAEIVIEFTPCFPQVYDMVLVVDLEGVGQDMLAVPIKAECLVPKVRVTPSDFLEFGNCFLRYPTTQQIQITNEDNLKAKFEIVPQDENSKRIGSYEADIMEGVIEPHKTQTVNLKLRTEILHGIRIPLYIKLEGHHIPVMITIIAHSKGPQVEVDRHEIDFGLVTVLKDKTETIKIMNQSDIDAEYTAFTKNKESIWKVKQRHGVLKPDEEKTIEVVCNPDELQKFNDTLHIIVNNGLDKDVALSAKGIGSTLYCKEGLDNIDFGTEYTHSNVPKQFFLENRGRKPMKIQWVRQTKVDRKNARREREREATQAGASGIGGLLGEKDDDMQFVFTVVPDNIVLNPKMGIMIEFRANSFHTGKISEPWQCQVLVGSDRKPKTQYTTNVFGNFITPSLQFNQPKLDFKYLWEKGVPSMPITKELVIKNSGPLPTGINLKIDPPFSCPVEKLTLEKEQQEVVKIDFDPGMKQDRVSDHINGKMMITHENHPHKDTVLLQGEVCFPNLQILPPKIDFGCILNDTSKKKYLVLTNISEMAVAYEWSFLEEAPILDEQDEIEDNTGTNGKKKKKKKAKLLPINEVFDILPVSGILLPGQTENVEFTFYSGNGLNYNGMAVCSVDGGPDYDVPIAGDSSFMSKHLSTTELDFGEVAYNESANKEFFIENIGKVPFEFSINLSTVSRPGLVECIPMSGKVIAGDKFSVTVRFSPGIPDNIHEFFLVECGHFPAERFTVNAVGIYPGCLLSFPRSDDDEFNNRFDSTKQLLENNEVKYSALFKGVEALKNMPVNLPKFIEKGKTVIEDPYVMDVEAECDRQLLCEKIVSKIDQQLQQQQMNNSTNSTFEQAVSAVPISLASKEDKKQEKADRSAKAVKGAKGTKEKNPKNTTNGFPEGTNSHGHIKVGGASINLENINISTYVCDFGNVIVGSSKKKSFRLTNVGKIPVSFNFDKKLQSQANISIEPDKVQKLMPNTSQFFTVVYTTRKQAKQKREKFLIPVDVRGGPQYMIEFIANQTIPELTMSSETLDFEQVCVNTRKTVKIRLENTKEVNCEWWFHTKPEPTVSVIGGGAKKEEGERYQVWPHNGLLLPGQRQTVDVMFTPNSDKVFQQKLAFKCTDNPTKTFYLHVKGQGINYNVEMVPETLKLGPVLPYDSSAIASFELRNPMEVPIEIYSLDFDKQYLEEEEILKRMENFQVIGSGEQLFLPFRKAGGVFWPSIRQQDEKKLAIEQAKTNLKSLDEQLNTLKTEELALIDFTAEKKRREENVAIEGEERPELTEPTKTQEQIDEERAELSDKKANQESQLGELLTDQLEVALPTAIKEENRLNVILYGPDASGRTTTANYMAQEHQRSIIRMDQLVDFWQKRGHAMYDEAAKILEEKAEKLAADLAEEEKNKKKKKKKNEEEVEIKREEYKYLPRELLVRMLSKRLEEEDCNAGAIFDNLTSEYWPGDKFGVELICDAAPRQNVQVVLFNFNKEGGHQNAEDGEEGADEEEMEVCTNYRYARRHNPAFQTTKEDKPAEQTESKKSLKKSSNAKARKPIKEAKKNPVQIAAEAKAAEEAEEQRRRKEAEIGKKKAEEAARALYKPKDYTSEEKEEWIKNAEDFQNFFGDIIMRQIVSDENAEEEESKSQHDEAKVEGSANGEEAEAQAPVEKIKYGSRVIREQNIQYDFAFLCEEICTVVPEPMWPDPDKEPLPAPLINSIQKRPPARSDREKITKFSIWTPIPEDQLPAPEEGAEASEKDEEKEGEVKDKLPAMSEKQTRWVLQPKESTKLFVKFFSTKIGTYNQTLNFEIVGSYKHHFDLNLQAVCEFPTINQNPRNLFLQQKKQRPPTEPDSFLQKAYVISEGVFDFGPLLIKKDPETREDETVKAVNGTFFQITNNGKYKLEANFTLRSTLPVEEGGPVEKSPFILEPSEVSLDIDETLNLNVFAFPEEAKLYTDEVIVLIKDNPNPAIFQIQCLGAKPVVNVDFETVKFERALIGKNLTKTLTLTNNCAIPVKWALTGEDKLSKEFTVSKTSGTLKPCKQEPIDISFNAIKDQKFLETLKLEVEDIEEYQIRQEDKTITLDAEAFNITLNEQMQFDQELDFEAVRVGEPKEQTLFLKNQGQYPIKFDFTMKRRQTREIFTIEPMEGKLEPNEDKNIIVKFLSHKEIKLKTTSSSSDIYLNILNIQENDKTEKYQSIPILVNVNAVFSKYSISPLRNLNFGPMQYSEQTTRTFELRNEGLFDFKYAICDFLNEEEKKKIRDERQKEMEERLAGKEEEKEDVKVKPKKAEPKAAKGKGKAEPIPDGSVVNVTQYTVQPAIGSVAPGSAAVISVTFNAQGAKFYDSTLAIDIANRDPTDQADGIPFQLAAESSIPGINTQDMDQIFEEQTVIPSLDPSINTQTIISSSLFSIMENVFWFGTLVASKNPEGAKERFKIINPNKIPCTVKFSVKPRSQSKSEGFAFDVYPDGLTIDPHKHKYVTIGFNPTEMKNYGGIFEAIVESGDPDSKTGKLVFELRGEGTLPTLQVEKPTEHENDGTPALKFRKTRIGKDTIIPIILKNEGQVPATARFDAITNDSFSFEGSSLNHTITQKSYHAFDIRFTPTKAQVEKFLLTFQTMHNVFEQHKVMLIGEGFEESVTFEGLPEGLEDELNVGDCVIGKAKAVTFQLVNNGEKDVKFRWNQGDKDEFRFFPSVGHLKSHSSKNIKVMVKGTKTVKYEKVDLVCETQVIEQKHDSDDAAFSDWDDTMKTLRMVRPTEYKKIMQEREAEERKRKEEAEAAAAAAVKKGKAPPKQKKEDIVEEEIVIDESEEPTVELIEVIAEPEFQKVDGSEKTFPLKTSAVIDYASYDCEVNRVDFRPTLMYAARTFKFTIKNTSLINLDFNFKIANSSTGILDAGPYSIIPKKGSIAPDCDDNFIVKFSPIEVEADFSRILSANINNLNPNKDALIIEANGIAERPVIHFELPPSTYREKKEKDMTPVDTKLKVIEFESLGTNIKNTKRFMAVNPTSSGYEFEWEEIPDLDKKQKPLFRCVTPKGLILSGKKSEMVFEYTPDSVGEHESKWVFRIPSEGITQTFLVVGHVNEPNVLFQTGKLKFGPLLLQGKNKETIRIINQEHIPFAFNFSKESVKGSPDYGDSLRVSPMSGVVPALSDLPIEINFSPKFELTYNYNLTCNVKRKARPLVFNIKGEGYKIHHSVFADEPKVEVSSSSPFDLQFGEFFINEKKTKLVTLTNNGEFNFDFVWKRQVNKYVTITPETGTVQKGGNVVIEVTYLPIAEHQLKNYKSTLTIVSGPKYDFNLIGIARKPGVKLNQHVFDFGQCFVTAQPTPIKKILEITNQDTAAISLESDFEKKPYLDFPIVPGQVLMPSATEKLQVPILFTPREIRAYNETIKLDFNGLYFVDINIIGQGIPLQLDLKDPDQAYTNLGIVSVGGEVSRTVPLINRSQKSVKFYIQPRDKEAFVKSALTISPDEKSEVILKPKESFPIEFRFKPKTRLPDFEHDIMLKVEGVEEERKLITVHGVAHGIELKLMDEAIAFGNVVKDSRLTKTLQMSNFGDVKANYSWDTKAFGKNFTISPASGYVNPNSNLDLEVTFHPKVVDSDLRQKVTCEVRGGEQIALAMMGKSVAQESSQTQELAFTTIVRKSTTQTVTIQNTEDKEWAINPTISTASDSCKGYFTGRSTLIVPAKGSAKFEVDYLPKTMTKKTKAEDSDELEDVPHQGSLFFPLPNGTALLYNLKGIATEPEREDLITETVVAKKQKNFIVAVKNWAKQTQRFSANWEVEGAQDSGLFIRGSDTFDVAGESHRDYKLNFMALRAGVQKFKLTFKAKDSGEYVFYQFQITVEENKEVEEIELVSPIRESISHGIVFENPTSEDVVINRSQFVVANEYVEITPEEQTIKAREAREFQVSFRPLMISESQSDLTVKNPVLGDYKYKLLLKGIAPTSQRSLAFKCALGQDQMQAFRFTHFLKKQTNYAVKVERADGLGQVDFKAEVAQVPAPIAETYKGVDVQVNVKYEPFTIGDSRGVLKLTSPEGMEYSCLLFGKSSAPQPQGPIKCIPGAKPVGVDFKNPLNEKSEFAVNFDNPNFSLASKLPGLVDPGKVTALQIKFDGKADFPNTGRMIVTTKGLPPWIYYLQGE